MLPVSLVDNKRNNTAINNIVVTKITDTKSPPMKKPRKIVQELITADATYPVSERKEIYLCINATNKEHDCKFGLCRQCYLNHSPTRKIRRKRSDEDSSCCNHGSLSSLHQFFDKQFFTLKYMEQVKKRQIAWTTNCNECQIKFVCTDRSGKII